MKRTENREQRAVLSKKKSFVHKLFLYPVLCTLCSIAGALPQDGGKEGSFLAWGAGARALGLGKAYVALARDATATYWNPSGLAFADHAEASVLHAALWEGANYDFVSAALPTLTEGSWGISATILSVGGVERRDASNTALGGEAGLIKEAFGLSYGFELFPNLGLGLTIKHIGRWFDGDHSGFLTGDVGVQWEVLPEILVGGMVQHAASFKYGNSDDTLPWRGRLGLAVILPWVGIVGADLEQSGRWHVGVESTPLGPLTVRTGLDVFEWSAGVGIQYDPIRLDYTAAQHLDLGLSHRFSFTVALGDSVGTQRLARAKAAYDRAVEAYAAGEKDKAEAELLTVMQYDKSNTLAPRLLNRIKQ